MAQKEEEQRTEVEIKQTQAVAMDPKAHVKKPRRARKTMTQSSRKQVEMLRNLHKLGQSGGSTYPIDVRLRMVETDSLNRDPCKETDPNHAREETAKEPVANLVVNSEISIYNDHRDLSRDLPCKADSEGKRFLSAGSLQDLLYTLYQKESCSPVTKPVEVHLYSNPSDPPLDGSEQLMSTSASPSGNFPALVEAGEQTEHKPDNRDAAVLEQQKDAVQFCHVSPDNAPRKRKPSGREEDTACKRPNSDETTEDSRRRKASGCEGDVSREHLRPSDGIAEGSGTHLDKSQSGLDKVKSFIQSQIALAVGNLDQKVQQLHERVDNIQCLRKQKQTAVRIAKKIAWVYRRVNSVAAFQQAQVQHKANPPSTTARNTILNAAKPIPDIPNNPPVPPRCPLDKAPPTTAQSQHLDKAHPGAMPPLWVPTDDSLRSPPHHPCSAKETSLAVPASAVQAANSADVKLKRRSLNAGTSADIPRTPQNMLVIDLTEEDVHRDKGKEVPVKVNGPLESIGPKPPLQPTTESPKESVAKAATDPGNNLSSTSSKACTLPEKASLDNTCTGKPSHQIPSPYVPASLSHLPPLPRTHLFPEHTNGFRDPVLPQKLELAVVHVQNPKGFALKWTVRQVDPRCAPLESFHLFMCCERPDGSLTAWTKLDKIKALTLPMACTLSQSPMSGKCHFIIQSRDIWGRFGPFCDIQSISAL